MKKIAFVLIALSVFIPAALFSQKVMETYNRPSYKLQNSREISFENIHQANQTEIASVTGFLKDFKGQDFSEVMKPLLMKLVIKTVDQSIFMKFHGLNIEGLRLTGKEIAALNESGKDKYYSHMYKLIKKFALSAEDYDNADKMLAVYQQHTTYFLSKQIADLREYLHLAKDLNYTYLEMYCDFTGFEHPVFRTKYYESKDQIHWAMHYTQAIQRLKDMIAEGCPEVFSPEYELPIKIYPNPFINQATISVEMPFQDVFTATASDVQGNSKVLFANQTLEKGNYTFTINKEDLTQFNGSSLIVKVSIGTTTKEFHLVNLKN